MKNKHTRSLFSSRPARLGAALVFGTFLVLLFLSLPILAQTPDGLDSALPCPGGVGEVSALVTAINDANLNPGPDTIALAANCSYTLTAVNNGSGDDANGLPVVSSTLTIDGQGATIVRELTATSFRILRVSSAGVLHLDGVTIQNGAARDGAGLYNDLGQVSVSDSTFAYNRATVGSGTHYGGAIRSEGVLTVARSTFISNTAHSITAVGGAIFARGTSIVQNSTFSDNNTFGALAGGSGGAIYHGWTATAGAMTVTNCTLAGNGADSGGGIYSDGGISTVLRNTILTNNQGNNCGGAILTNGGGNIQYGGSTADSCGAAIPVQDPKLGPLQDNGGPSWTMALLQSSPAIDNVDCSNAPATDQRGVPRPQGASCDSGAYEAQANLHLSKSVDQTTVDVGQRITYTIIVSNASQITATGTVISDGLASGLTFAGPIQLHPASAGTVGTSPPILAHNVVINPGGAVTVTVPVTVTGGTTVTNIAAGSVSDVLAPATGSVTITVRAPVEVHLPVVLRVY